jgi:hypothetical protein
MEVTQEQRDAEAAMLERRARAQAQAQPQPEVEVEVETVRGLVVSAPPRPIAKPTQEDIFAAYDAGMRPKAAELYRRLQAGPVHIEAGLPDVVVWMRARGVRILCRMSAEGSFYELERMPEEVAAKAL